MTELKMYVCEKCGNVTMKLVDGKAPMSCCGQHMTVLAGHTTDGALEKHVPALTLEGSILHVQVGDVLHPMLPEHFIQWILVHQGDRVQVAYLTPDQEPKADFIIDPASPATVYEYCNLHGMWKAELE